MRTARVGDLVNNIHTHDYNYGVVLETNVNIVKELYLEEEEELILYRLGENALGDEPPATEPDGIRVLWEGGVVNVHYSDELEILSEKQKAKVFPG